MPKNPAFGSLPKKHTIHTAEEERAERLLHQAEDENRRFNEISREIAANISIQQLGINEKVARVMAQGVIGPNGETPSLTRLREEKIQSELYRQVQGNEFYETEFGEDSKNYLGSLNVEHMESSLPRRMVRQMRRVRRGVTSVLVGDTLVESEVRRRFGSNRIPEARREFVANRLRPVLQNYATTMPARLEAIYLHFGMALAPGGVATQIDDFLDILSNTGLLRLREFRDWCRNPAVAEPFETEEAFRDLMMLASVDQKTTTESGLEAVYDFQKLRARWENWRTTPGVTQQITNEVTNMLIPNSLFPLENNSDGKALLAELHVRMQTRGALATLNELRSINLDESQISPELRTRIDTCRNVMGPLLTETVTLAQSINDLTQRLNDPATGLLAQVAAARTAVSRARSALVPPATTSPALDTAEADLARLTSERDAANADLRSSNTRIRENAQKAITAMTAANALGLLPTHVFPGIGFAGTPINVFEAIRSSTGIAPNVGLIIADLVDINTNVMPNLETSLRNQGTFTPFVLVQRLMRRDYLESQNNMDPAQAVEEANHYATVKAALRIEEIENIDRKRTANAQAAEFLDRGLWKRGWDKLRRFVARGQDIIGLEPINIKYQTADRILEQIIGSDPQFAVFKGINKFTTTRDLRKIFNESGVTVSQETIKRFAETVEEAISRFKHIPPELEKDLNPNDWDLENTVTVLKKLRIEMWSRKMIETVNTSGAANRERALVTLLRGEREIDQNISKGIEAEVKHNPNAVWRKFLVKDALKAMLNEKELTAWKKIRQAGIENMKKSLTKKTAERDALPENDSRRLKLNKEIENISVDIKVIEDQIKESTDLYEKVETARTYIRENKLSRKEKKLYLQEMGLTQVFDKMSTNFRMQRAWHHTKRAASAGWSGTKKAWKWSREKFLNWKTAKSAASKTFSVGRLLATPATWTLDKAWKIGTFPARLTYRALRRATHMPKRLLGVFSKGMMRSYLRDRIIDLENKAAAIAQKQTKLNAKIAKAPYSWDVRRLQNKINALEDDRVGLLEDAQAYRKMAADKKINLGRFALHGPPANDNATAPKKETAAPAPAPKESPKKAA